MPKKLYPDDVLEALEATGFVRDAPESRTWSNEETDEVLLFDAEDGVWLYDEYGDCDDDDELEEIGGHAALLEWLGIS